MTKAALLAICASIFWGMGIALQKKGIDASFPKISLAKFFSQIFLIVKTLLQNSVWAIGLFCMFCGMGFFAYALAAGDISIVQPMVNLTIVVATLAGVIFLHEKVSPMEWVGIGVMLIGVFFIALEIKAGSNGSFLPISFSLPTKSTAILPNTLEIGIMTLVFCLIIIASLLVDKIGIKLDQAFSLSIAGGLCFALANTMGKVMTQRVIEKIGFFSLTDAGCLGAIFTDFPIYFIAIANIFGFSFQQTAFANGRVSLVAPVQTILANTAPIVAAIIVFSESFGVSRGIGIGMTVIGVALMAFRKEDDDRLAQTEKNIREGS